MNERIKELWEEATVSTWPRSGKFTAGEYDYHLEKFAELLIAECKENFAKVWYEQGMDIRGGEIIKFLDRFDEYLGVEE